jgi:glycosyltransferase involved in cell wall biosynthesis
LLEAGASGLPVVATDHEGIRDVVLDGDTGFLVEERDVASMAAQMLRLAADPALAGSLGRNARRRVCNHFTLEQSVDRLWRIVEAAIAGEAPRATAAAHQ